MCVGGQAEEHLHLEVVAIREPLAAANVKIVQVYTHTHTTEVHTVRTRHSNTQPYHFAVLWADVPRVKRSECLDCRVIGSIGT